MIELIPTTVKLTESMFVLLVKHHSRRSPIFICLLQFYVKGIVHPKMKILSSFTHPQVVPNLYECVCFSEHKGRYSEECGKQSSSGSLYFFSYYGSQWCPKTAWLQTFFKIFSFVFGRTKTFIKVWNYLRVSK